MRKTVLMIAAAGVLSAGLLASPAAAFVGGGADSVRAAANEAGVLQPVHCRPGFWHHRFAPHDGCLRRYYYGGTYGTYGAYGSPYSDYGYYGSPGFYGPGVSFRFGFGPRRWGW